VDSKPINNVVTKNNSFRSVDTCKELSEIQNNHEKSDIQNNNENQEKKEIDQSFHKNISFDSQISKLSPIDSTGIFNFNHNNSKKLRF
jgi:hypothetical protein